MSLCLAAAGLAVQVAASQFSLSWTHTIEKTAWEEDWRIEQGLLVLEQARVQGSGAGMEPPPEARVESGFYVWEPATPPMEQLILRRAGEAGDWRLCAAGRCASMAEWLGGEGDPVRLRSCADDPPQNSAATSARPGQLPSAAP
jgi:hypothetical protein